MASDESAVRATFIHNRSTLVPQGTIISAVLETPIDSTRPGLVRAVVARDARGFDGTRVLIPKGSRLIGQAGGDAKPGQHRVLVEWSRLIRPDGVAMRIGSPASDPLGGAGIAGHVNSHFFARFANAALQSAMSAGVAVASRSSGSPYIYALPGPALAAGQSLFPDIPPGATIKVHSGTAIAVFVAHDLDFSGTASSR
jgi:type IV secretion system protein VirB10